MTQASEATRLRPPPQRTRKVRSSVRPEAGRRQPQRDSGVYAATYNGMLPCLRRGSSSRLLRSMVRPATIFWRVSAGSMTSST